MGKAALFFVAAFSLAGARLMYTSQEADVKSAQNQGDYETDVIAREIARSAYNAATADVHRYGTDIDRALREFGPAVTDCASGQKLCYRRTGEMLGGTYLVEASADGGNGIDLYAVGRFSYDAGGHELSGEHEINESQSVNVLQVAKGGKLRIQFVDSEAGFCSAIFLKRTIPGKADHEQPGIEMVYAPGKKRNGERNSGFEVDLEPGTQMNFAIGVDSNWKCHESGQGRPARFPKLRMFDADRLAKTADPRGASHPDFDPDYGAKLLLAEMAEYDYRESDWAWTHWALDGTALRDGDPQEAPWAMVETDPHNNQRWRIAFEDIDDWNLLSTAAGFHNPNLSLWATKHYGYDWAGSFDKPGNDGKGDGWTDNVCTEILPKTGAGAKKGEYTVRNVSGRPDGFHDLRDTGRPADFSDQVIMVEIVPPGGSFDDSSRNRCRTVS